MTFYFDSKIEATKHRIMKLTTTTEHLYKHFGEKNIWGILEFLSALVAVNLGISGLKWESASDRKNFYYSLRRRRQKLFRWGCSSEILRFYVLQEAFFDELTKTQTYSVLLPKKTKEDQLKTRRRRMVPYYRGLCSDTTAFKYFTFWQCLCDFKQLSSWVNSFFTFKIKMEFYSHFCSFLKKPMKWLSFCFLILKGCVIERQSMRK